MVLHDIEQIPADSVVVGVDGSEHSERAVAWAAAVAAGQHRRLVLLHTDAELPSYQQAVLATYGIDWTQVRESASAAMTEVLTAATATARAAHPDLEVETVATLLDPRRALVDASRRAHLVVLGSRGRGPVSSLLLGSVSRYVAAHGECPVVVLRPSKDVAPGTGIVAAVDGTPESAPVVELAFEHAALLGVPVRVVHCFWDVSGVVPGQEVEIESADYDDLRSVLSQAVAGMREKYPDVEVHLELEVGLADQALLRAAEHADLLVVGRHEVKGLQRMLYQSTATAVLERADCPVAVVAALS